MVFDTVSEEWKHEDYWRNICPLLTINDCPHDNRVFLSMASSEVERAQWKNQIARRGFALVDGGLYDQSSSNSSSPSPYSTQVLARSIEELARKGIPETAVFLYNEAWEVLEATSSLLRQCTSSSNAVHHDVLAVRVAAGSVGFSPHRDRQPDPVAPSFHKVEGDNGHDHDQDQDLGIPKYATCWLALTDATPENSCLYVLPRRHDPGYMAGDDDGNDYGDEDPPSPLDRAMVDKESYQLIRSLPRKAGQAVLFSHRLLHWGSRVDEEDVDATAPPPARIALSTVVSDPSFEKPYLKICGDKPPPFSLRLLLVCAQSLVYHQRFSNVMYPERIRACYNYCKQHQDDLEETYYRKVMVEFVRAMKECRKEDCRAAPNTNAKPDSDLIHSAKLDDDEDDNEEAILQEMLDSEAAGCGDEFSDDYDEMDDNCTSDNEEKTLDSQEQDSNEESIEEEDQECFPFASKSNDPKVGKSKTKDATSKEEVTPFLQSSKRPSRSLTKNPNQTNTCTQSLDHSNLNRPDDQYQMKKKVKKT